MQKHLLVWLTMLLWFFTNKILVYASLFESFLWWSSFWTNGELWRQRFKPLRLFEFHEGKEKLHLHCLKLLCSSSLLLPLQNTFSPGASSEDVNGAPGSGLSVKRLYTLSCCCVYLIISLLSFFQLCPPKFAMPLDLHPYPPRRFTSSVFPHIAAVLSSLFLHWRFSSRRDRARRSLPVQSLRTVGVCLMSVNFLLPLTIPLSPPFPYLPCHSFLPYFHLFYQAASPVGFLFGSLCSAFFHPSINYS